MEDLTSSEETLEVNLFGRICVKTIWTEFAAADEGVC